MIPCLPTEPHVVLTAALATRVNYQRWIGADPVSSFDSRAAAAAAGLVPPPPWGIGSAATGVAAAVRGSAAAVAPTCDGDGLVERLATPTEVDAGCELGIAYDPCPGCAVCRPSCREADRLTLAVCTLRLGHGGAHRAVDESFEIGWADHG